MPFNCKTPLGLAFYLITVSPSTFCILFCAVPSTCFFIGSGWLLISFAKNMRNDLSHFNAVASSRRHRAEVKGSFCQIIQIYSDVKELSDIVFNLVVNGIKFIFIKFLTLFRIVGEFNVVYEYKILALFLWTLLSIASSLIVFQIELVKYKTL